MVAGTMSVKQAMHSIFGTNGGDNEVAQTTSTTVNSSNQEVKKDEIKSPGTEHSSDDEDIDIDQVKNRTVERIKAAHNKRTNKYK